MSFVDTLKAKHTESVKKKKYPIPKRVLGVLLGEISTIQGRVGKAGACHPAPMSDAEVVELIKKMIKDVRKSADTMSEYNRQEEPMYEDLLDEMDYLYTLLPNKPLTTSDILLELTSQLEAIKKASSDGAALGMAMKFLKQGKHEVLSDDVSEVVKSLRKE